LGVNISGSVMEAHFVASIDKMRSSLAFTAVISLRGPVALPPPPTFERKIWKNMFGGNIPTHSLEYFGAMVPHSPSPLYSAELCAPVLAFVFYLV